MDLVRGTDRLKSRLLQQVTKPTNSPPKVDGKVEDSWEYDRKNMTTCELLIPIEIVKLKSVFVCLENCLKDVQPKKSELPKLVPEQPEIEAFVRNQTDTIDHKCYSTDVFSENQDDGLKTDNGVLVTLDSSVDTNVCTSDVEEHNSLMPNMPGSFKFPELVDIAIDVEKGNLEENPYDLLWDDLAEPSVIEGGTPLGSSGNSPVNLNLTPPCSSVSGSSQASTDGYIDDFLPLQKDYMKCDIHIPFCQEKVVTDLLVKVNAFEPTLKQLQSLYRQTLFKNSVKSKCTFRESNFRPRRNRKQFIPFMSEIGEKPQRNSKSIRKIKRDRNVKRQKCFHSTPKDKRARAEPPKRGKKKMSSPRTPGAGITLKNQMKLALKQKKEALKERNRFENALSSINMRICNQNSLWRVLGR